MINVNPVVLGPIAFRIYYLNPWGLGRMRLPINCLNNWAWAIPFGKTLVPKGPGPKGPQGARDLTPQRGFSRL